MARRVEVQDVFREHGSEYLNTYHPPPHIYKAVRAIINCRTNVPGGHSDFCNECDYTKISYNSCRNRHCPKCQALAKERWLMNRQAELLPVPYFHVVFTLPSELDEIVIHDKVPMYNLLLKASQETIRELAADKKYLGVKIGLTSILHTWGQNLTFHPHVHMIVPGGGLTKDGRFTHSSKKFFIPVKVMSRLFRGKFLFYFKRMLKSLEFHETAARFYDSSEELINSLYRKEWYVYCKRPFKTAHSILEYLGRYTHRIAISNHRIISVDDGKVTFKYRDYQDKSREKVMVLKADEFMRRFLLHILPPQFTKIRHYGILASAVKGRELTLCFKILGLTVFVCGEPVGTAELIKMLTGIDIHICPVCGSGLARAAPCAE
ncbi:MAG: IS91 family transposase [Lachnospiraceae bacterium]|nr:IS91 family transposase [Lachnospiraceae bacterium]